MKKIPKYIKIQLIFALIAGALLLGFELLKAYPHAMAFWADRISKPLRYFLARVCSFTAWSVGEWLIAGAAAFAVVFIAVSAVAIVRHKGQRLLTLAHRVLIIGNIALFLWFFMCCNWGVGYYAPGYAARMGVTPVESTPEELRQVTEQFARELSAASTEVPRGEDGVFAIDIDWILAESMGLMRPLEEACPALTGQELLPKKARFSRLMSCITTTGYLFPYTGEANINIDAPACYLPCTVMHEISHQRGVATEQEANFFGILACLESSSPEFRYSGYVTAYTYLHNALYTVDPEGVSEIYSSLAPGVHADLAANSAYWRQFEGKVSEASDKAYDSFLKNYDQELGRKSYGAVVDLLMAYYG